MKLKSNFAITGFMGAGKTTLYQAIENKINAYDLDQLIYKEVGSIKRYIEASGENSFRELEYQVLKMLSNEDYHLIFLGAGALEHPQSHQLILKNYQLIHLNVELEVILKRLDQQQIKSRPLFKNVDELYDKRMDKYSQAQFIIQGNREVSDNVKTLKEIIFE